MKTLKLALIAATLGLSYNATGQIVEHVFANDTVKGAQTKYFTSGYKVKDYSGIVLFSLVKTDIADSLSALNIQGANHSDFTDAVNLGSTAALAATTTNGATILYETVPKYMYYRLRATCAAGDTVAISKVKFIYKK